MKQIITFIFLLLISQVHAQSLIKGKVYDSKTNETLPFVNISVEKTGKGTISDIDGVFKIEVEKTGNLLFSYVGYEKFSLPLTDSILKLENIRVKLVSKNFELKEVVIVAGENPAHRIINKAIKNREINNPENLPGFYYTSYNKTIFIPKLDSSIVSDFEKRKNLDTTTQEILNYTDKKHLLMMESVNERYFKEPEKNKEKIIASRISGLKDPTLSLLSSQMQSFSFYNELVSISEKSYVNPIAKGGTERYFFLLEDTIYSGTDSIFIISYKPGRGKIFPGLKGVLYINTNGYAIQNVIAEAADPEPVFGIKIQQQYEFVDGKHWFPVQLNTDILYKIVQLNNFDLFGISRSYIQNINFNPDYTKVKFSNNELEITNDVADKAEEFWEKHRKDSLNEKETSTYHFIDSIGNAENLDLKLKFAKAVSTGKLPCGFIDFDINRFLTFNDYEGIRAGIGISSNAKFSSHFVLGTYFAYGIKDKAFKYGSRLTLNLYEPHEIKLSGSFSMDIIESGSVNFMFDRKPELSESNRQFLLQRFDSIQKAEISFSFRIFNYLLFGISANQQNRIFNGHYSFGNQSENVTVTTNQLWVSELSTGIKFAYKEKFIKLPGISYSTGTNYPVLWFQITKGVSGFLNSQFDYSKFDFKLEKSFTSANLGKSSFQFLAGYIRGDLPYTLLYNGRGSFKPYTISVMNSFETMGMNEFLSNRYANLFFNHNFGNRLIKTEKFKPEFVFITNAGWGTLNNENNHRNIAFKTMEKGLFESGLIINNIIRSMFLGAGIGIFYRYGSYSYPQTTKNIALKFSFTFVF